MAKLFLFLVCVAAIVILGCVQKTPSILVNNATYEKCISDGGLERLVYRPNGQASLCLFPDGTVCDSQFLLQGKCKKGDCARKCELVGTRAEGWYDCNKVLLFYDKCSNETAVTAGTC